jgi:hypothetical protein
MADEVPGTLRATFPPLTCGPNVRYYVAADLSNGGTSTDPVGAPGVYYTAVVRTSSSLVMAESFEGDVSAWTVTSDPTVISGAWAAGVPIGTASGTNIASPTADATPGSGNKCFVTGLGAVGGTAASQDLDGGPTTLTSPAIDLSAASAASLTVSLWYFCDDIASNTTAEIDPFRVEVSNGGPWVLMEQIKTNINTAWNARTYLLNDFVTLNSTVRVRFVAVDQPNNSTTEAGVDEFIVTAYQCAAAQPCPADLNGDRKVDAADLATLLNSWGGSSPDLNGDGIVSASDLAVILNAWGPCQ